MKVVDTLAGGRAGVGHQPEAPIGYPALAGELGRDREESPEHLGVLLGQVSRGVDVLARDNKDVSWGLGVDVAERHDQVILMNEVGRHLTDDDPTKQTPVRFHLSNVMGRVTARTRVWSTSGTR
jgi:hypothetical protein